MINLPRKYNNKIVEYDGNHYHSKAEATYAHYLDLRVQGKDIKNWKRQVAIPLEVNGKRIAIYRMDFVITHNDDSLEYIEIKGAKTTLWIMKAKLYQALYPDHRYTVIDAKDVK